jgi:D-methionine transport system ATP-binding protein
MALIEFNHVNKIFSLGGREVQALKDVTFSVEKGDIFGVIGFSGAGKSTLLRMVNSLEIPTSGSVIIHNQKVNGLPYRELRKLRKNIGMVFQQFNLLESKTVYENTALPLRLEHIEETAVDQIVMMLLKFVNLEDRKDSYPDQLSGGQKQRVGIARALTTNPSILLCDEATSALDPDTTEQILQLLKQINQKFNITILMVTHEIDAIQKICNRVAVMERGKVVEMGSVLDIFTDPQEEITKRFVHTVIPDTVPRSIRVRMKKEKRPYKLLKVCLLDDEAAENIFYPMNASLGIETHIVFATVSELQKMALGIYIIQVIDRNGAAEKAADYLSQRGIKWKEVML